MAKMPAGAAAREAAPEPRARGMAQGRARHRPQARRPPPARARAAQAVRQPLTTGLRPRGRLGAAGPGDGARDV